jgi:hypothetical protein
LQTFISIKCSVPFEALGQLLLLLLFAWTESHGNI